MNPGKLVSLDIRLLQAFICNHHGCNRCYSQSNGYFDFVAGQSYVIEQQKLCEVDSHAMYLESVRSDGEETWCCPNCGSVEHC